MKLFAQYIKQRRLVLCASAVFILIFIFSFSLYHLPVMAVIYPASLCALLGVIFMIFDFRRVKQRHDLLKNIKTITDAVSRTFPDTDEINCRDCREIIRLICEEHKEFRTETERKYSDMADYYTVWVHQIKTPIASMRLHLQNEDTALSRKLSADLFRVEQYVEMVLTFLRLNSESTDYVIKEYDLDLIVKQAVKKFAGEFIGRKLKLIYKPLNAKVVTDEKWLSFVIEQILSNALKYTPSGSIAITLEPGKKLCIRDSGIGIAPEDLPRIFENGFTGYNGRSDKKASGIGLYLCKRVCENLGHKIEVSSAVGEGTAVTLGLSQKKLNVE